MPDTTPLTDRDRALAVLHGRPCDRLPVVHFGFWHETLVRWAGQGHLPLELARAWGDGNAADAEISRRLGFDFDWQSFVAPNAGLRPGFAREVVATLPDGSRHVRNGHGVTILEAPGAGSIPAEIGHLLTDRAAFEQHYRHRLAWCRERVDEARVFDGQQHLPLPTGGLDLLRQADRPRFIELHCGSLIGVVRDIIGVEGLAYIGADDPGLLAELVGAFADLSYRNTEAILALGARFAYAHFWEDICYKNGPLVSPAFFAEVVCPHYRRIADLLRRHGVDLIGVDCDGQIDALLPHWLEAGVNVMFPIEVGTWQASIAPWRKQYGDAVKGVGGMDKRVFAQDRAAIEAEVERLAALVDLGGYLPCPDHRIAPDAEWDLVRHYCERMRTRFG